MPYPEKQVSDKIIRTTEAWEEHAGDAEFAEMTLDEFKAKVKPSLDSREKIASLRRQLEAAIKKRQEMRRRLDRYLHQGGQRRARRHRTRRGQRVLQGAGLRAEERTQSGLRRMAALKKAA